MTKLLRVQDLEGRGPYRPGLSKFWADPQGPALMPWWVELGLGMYEAFARIPEGMFGGSAFRTAEQYDTWFSAAERAKLDAIGFYLVRFRPDKIVFETPTQVVFAQNYPLSGLPKASRLIFTPAEPCLPSHASRFGSAAGDTNVSGGTLAHPGQQAHENINQDFTNRRGATASLHVASLNAGGQRDHG
jgi:hypothetical protein